MIDPYTLEQCKLNKGILQTKIRNIVHAIEQSEAMISESRMNDEVLFSLRDKIACSRKDLEVLFEIMDFHNKDIVKK